MAFSATVQGIGSLAGTVEGQTAFLASMAAMGPKGDKGDTGSAATIAVGTTSTLPAGSSATVANVGTSGAAVFDFGIPQGAKGDKGDTGDTGPQGPSGVVSATAPLAYDSGTKNLSIDLSAYLTVTSAASTYQTQAAMSAYLTTSSAASTYYPLTNPSGYITSSALTGYATESWVGSQGFITSSALSPYLLSSTAASTYQTISGMSAYAAKSSSNTFTANQIIEVTDNTNAALRVTQLGTGEAFRVEDSANPDSTPFVVTADGKVGVGVTAASIGTNAFMVGSAAGMSKFNGGINVALGATIDQIYVTTNGNITGTTTSVPLLACVQNGARSVATFTNTATATDSAVTITNLGTGNSFVVNDQASDPSPFVIDSSGNVSVGGTLDVTTAPAANDNSTKVPTTAWVQTYVPAASTSTAGKVQLATNAEAVTATSSTLAVTPDSLAEVMGHANFTRFNSVTLDSGTSGTGGTNASFAGGIARQTGAPTSTGAGYVRAGMAPQAGRGLGTTSSTDFTKRIIIQVRLVRNAASPSSDSIYRIVLGDTGSTNTGDPTYRSIGIKITGSGAMNILAHDGTTLTTYATSYTPTNATAFDLRLVSDAAGTVEAFVNGASVGSTTGGPTTRQSGANNNYLNFRAENLSSFTANPIFYYAYNPSVTICY